MGIAAERTYLEYLHTLIRRHVGNTEFLLNWMNELMSGEFVLMLLNTEPFLAPFWFKRQSINVEWCSSSWVVLSCKVVCSSLSTFDHEVTGGEEWDWLVVRENQTRWPKIMDCWRVNVPLQPIKFCRFGCFVESRQNNMRNLGCLSTYRTGTVKSRKQKMLWHRGSKSSILPVWRPERFVPQEEFDNRASNRWSRLLPSEQDTGTWLDDGMMQ